MRKLPFILGYLATLCYTTAALASNDPYQGTTIPPMAINGDCTASGPVQNSTITCTKSNGNNFAPSAFTDTTNAANITTGVIPVTRLPVATTTSLGAGIVGQGLSVTSSGVINNAAEQTISYTPGILTSLTNTISNYTLWNAAATLDNFTAGAYLLNVCTTNPTIQLLNCHTSTTCASPTVMAQAQTTAIGQAFSSSILSTAIAAGDYTAWRISGGACVSVGVNATAQTHSN